MDSGILGNCAACSPGRADLAWSPGWYGRGSLWSVSLRPFSLASGGGLRAAGCLSHQPGHKLRQNCRRCRPLSGFQRCSSGSDIAVSASRRGALHLRRRELLQQRLCSTQVMGVEALGKPAVDRSEKFSKVLISSPLIAPQRAVLIVARSSNDDNSGLYRASS